MNFGPVSFQSNLDDLGKAVLAYAKVSKRDLPVIVADQGAKLSATLFQKSAQTAPSEASLEALPQEKNWHILRTDKTGLVRPILTQGYELLTYKQKSRRGQFKRNKKGQIAHKMIGLEGIIPRRVRARFYQAAGWLSNRLGKYTGGAAASAGQKPNRAQVTLQLQGSQFLVSITNTSEAALEVAERTGYLAAAVDERIKDLVAVTKQRQDERAAEFNRQHLPTPH